MKKLNFNAMLGVAIFGLSLASCSNDDSNFGSDQQLRDEKNANIETKSTSVTVVNDFDIVRSSIFTAETFKISSDFAEGNVRGSAQILSFVSNPNREFIGQTLPQDVIDLSSIDANINTPEDDQFTIVDRFSGRAGELIVPDPGKPISGGAGTSFRLTIKGDVDGDGEEDLKILITEGLQGLANILTDSLVEQNLIIL